MELVEETADKTAEKLMAAIILLNFSLVVHTWNIIKIDKQCLSMYFKRVT